MDAEAIYKLLTTDEIENISGDKKEIIKSFKENFLKYKFFDCKIF